MTDEDIIRMAQEADACHDQVRVTPFLKRFATLVAAAEAEKHKWDIHSCGPTCGRYVCVARRKAVEDEREACAQVAEKMLRHYTQAVTGVPEAIRARG